MSEPPDFATLNEIEEELLIAKLKAIRRSITHAAEKGRALEHAVRGLLRDLLPAEYGLSTGFVVWLSPAGAQLSPQLDIIIYDAIRSGPLIHLNTCDVFPLEAVYGYVEVKATLRSSSDKARTPAKDSIEACIQKNLLIRRMGTRHFLAPLGGSPPQMVRVDVPWLLLRSYVVAFEPAGKVARSIDTLAGRLATGLKRAGVPAHLHGVLIPNHGLLYTQPVDEDGAAPDDYFHVRYTTDHALLAFKILLLRALATFQRPQKDWLCDVNGYFAHVSDWKEEKPSGIEQ